VQLEQVDPLDAELAQALVTLLAQVLRSAVGVPLRSRPAFVAIVSPS
jgi:hypothetical protein